MSNTHPIKTIRESTQMSNTHPIKTIRESSQ